MSKPRLFFRVGIILSIQLTELSAQGSWRVDSVPIAAFRDTANPRHGFVHPIGGVRVGRDAVAIADVHAGVIAFFDTAGRLLPLARGAPPRSFRHVSWIGRCGGDSVFVWDMMSKRMSVLNAGGGVAREFTLPTGSGQPPASIACTLSGVFAFQLLPSVNPAAVESGSFRDLQDVILSDRDGKLLSRIENVPTGEYVTVSGGAVPRPLGRITSLAGSADRLYVGTADSGVVSIYSTGGMQRGIVRVVAPQRSPSQRLFESSIQDIVSMIPVRIAPKIARELDSEEVPSAVPPYRSLLVDDDDLLWVVRSSVGERTEMRIYSADGKPLGDVLLPTALTPLSVGRNSIIGVARDSTGASAVLAYRLIRPRLEGKVRP